MRNVYMNGCTKDVQFAQTNTFAAKPIAVLNTMYVSVDRPGMKQCTSYPVLGQNTQTGPKDSTNQLESKC